MTAPRGSSRRRCVRVFMKSACATNWRVDRHAADWFINLIVIRVLTRQVWKLHQKVARKISRTLKNVWLLNDLALFQSDERLIINLLQVVSVVIMTGRSPPTVYAFLNPKFPSATWDFFCLKFEVAPLCRAAQKRKRRHLQAPLFIHSACFKQSRSRSTRR